MQNKQSKIKILIFAHYTVQDPPTANTIRTLVELGYSVVAIQQSFLKNSKIENLKNFKLINLYNFKHFYFLLGFEKLLTWIYYKLYVRIWIHMNNPDYLIGFMLHHLSAIKPNNNKYKLFSCIYDIPSIEFAGKLDKRIIKKGWKKLKNSDIVWASDFYKAELAQKYGNLNYLPTVCFNCPATDFFTEDLWPRDNWLREQLAKQGANILEDTCILIRAGAIGLSGGIEETLEAMLSLPSNIIFFMMGRTNENYKYKIKEMITELKLAKRVFLWCNPDDEIWKKALLGSDIGHLIHLRPESGAITANYDLNSSLSNNRLFQYMAAGLPIISYNDPRMDVIYNEVDCFKIVNIENLFDSLKKTIKNLSENADERIRLGKNGREAHLKKYNWEYQFKPVINKIMKDK